MDLDRTWKNYKDTGKDRYRDRLVEHYLPLLDRVSRRVHETLPQNVQFDDVRSYGVFGLLDAIEKFEPERGFKFETYASQRIKGAVIDELRKIDWAPRSLRAKARVLDNASNALQSELGRIPTSAEIAEQIGWDVEQVHEVNSQVHIAKVHSVDGNPMGPEESYATSEGEEFTLGSTIFEPGDQTFAIEWEGIAETLERSIHALPDKERIVMYLYYFESMSLEDIGEYMGVTESRVCQIHTKAIERGRERLSFTL